MPYTPSHPCTWPGCNILVQNSNRCERHRKQEKREIEDRRDSSSERGYDARWHKARTYYLAQHPLCFTCQIQGKIVAATVVDHIKPHKKDMALFWLTDNWQALCKACHDRK